MALNVGRRLGPYEIVAPIGAGGMGEVYKARRVVVPSPSAQAVLSYPRVSPDGRWLAYGSSESGRSQLYVTSFPNGSGKWQVSITGGDMAAWRRDGRAIYITDGSELQAADVTAVGRPCTPVPPPI